MKRHGYVTLVAAVTMFSLCSCWSSRVPHVVVTNANAILEFPSRVPISLESVRFFHIGCSCCPDGYEESLASAKVSMYVHHDEGALNAAFHKICSHAGRAKIVIVFSDQEYEMLAYPVDEAAEEIPELDSPSSSGTATVERQDIQFFRVTVFKGKVHLRDGQELKEWRPSYNAYLRTLPRVPTAFVCVASDDRISDLEPALRQLRSLGCGRIHLGLLKDGWAP